MYTIVIQPSYEIGFELLMVDDSNYEIVRHGTTCEYDIIDLLESIIETINKREEEKEKKEG